MATLAEQMAISAATIEALEEALASISEPDPPSPPPPPPTKSYKYVPKMPTPRSWKDEAELKDMVLRRLVPTAVADAGASSNCGAAPLVSTCGNYEIKTDPFISTGTTSMKVFRDAGGRLNPASHLKLLPMDVRSQANEVHMVPGV